MSTSDQKLYTDFWKYIHCHFASDWMALTQELKVIYLISERKGSTTKELVSLNVGEQKPLTKTAL